MREMLSAAGFSDINIEIKENAADIIKGWMPGSGAEKVITSAYVTASKPVTAPGLRDNVHADTSHADVAVSMTVEPVGSTPEAGC